MKKSELKALIKECLNEMDTAPNIANDTVFDSKIKSSDRAKISNALHTKPELGGTIKLDKKEKALTIINDVLSKIGYQLDMVSGDILLGDKGTRLLPYRRQIKSEDPFTEGPEIENSRISFTWENLGTPEQKKFEIIAYAT